MRSNQRTNYRATRSVALVASLLLYGGCSGSNKVTAYSGPASRLGLGALDTVVVNAVRPTRLKIHVLSHSGRELPDSGVRYGMIAVNPRMLIDSNTVTCLDATDATVRVSLGHLHANLFVRCRPVYHLLFERPMQLNVGEAAKRLPLKALDASLQEVDLLSGTATIANDSVASLEGLALLPKSAGATVVTVTIGNQTTSTGVHVYSPASTLDSLGRQHRFVSVPLELGPGEMRRWQIPPGEWMLTMLPEDDSTGIRMRIEGANCSDVRAFSPRRYICYARDTASVTVYHPQAGRRAVLKGELLVKGMSL